MTRFAALARHPLAIVGALMAAASAVVFIVLAIAAAAGMFHNPYAGLVIFIGIPALFVTGLLFMPAGMWLQRRKRARDPHADEWPVLDFRHPSVRRTALMIASITAANIVLVLLAGYGGLHWMESPAFCGQVCHTPMQPQFMAWQDASHGRYRLRQLPHRRRRCRVRPRQAVGRAATQSCHHHLLRTANAARGGDAPRRAGADLPRLPPAGAHDRGPDPRDSFVRRR